MSHKLIYTREPEKAGRDPLFILDLQASTVQIRSPRGNPFIERRGPEGSIVRQTVGTRHYVAQCPGTVSAMEEHIGDDGSSTLKFVHDRTRVVAAPAPVARMARGTMAPEPIPSSPIQNDAMMYAALVAAGDNVALAGFYVNTFGLTKTEAKAQAKRVIGSAKR